MQSKQFTWESGVLTADDYSLQSQVLPTPKHGSLIPQPLPADLHPSWVMQVTQAAEQAGYCSCQSSGTKPSQDFTNQIPNWNQAQKGEETERWAWVRLLNPAQPEGEGITARGLHKADALFSFFWKFPALWQDSKLLNFPPPYPGVCCNQRYASNFLLHVKAPLKHDIIKCTAWHAVLFNCCGHVS